MSNTFVSLETFTLPPPIDTPKAHTDSAPLRHDAPTIRRLASSAELSALYEIKEKLGDGNFAEVYAATCQKTGTEWALKRMKIENSRSTTVKAYLEAEILRRVRHRNIVRLREALISPNEVVFILERGVMTGTSLLQNRALRRDEARGLIRQLLEAVEYLHSHGIVHRDLKPDNILLCPSPSDRTKLDLKIIDFGLSKLVPGPGVRAPCSPCGTFNTMAPEVFEMIREGQSANALLTEAEVKSWDIFSVGAVAYMFLCNAPPFAGRTAEEVRRSLSLGEMSLMRTPAFNRLPFDCKDFLTSCLAPTTRPTASEALSHPWLVDPSAPRTAAVEHPRVKAKLDHFYGLHNLEEMVYSLTRTDSFSGAQDDDAPMPLDALEDCLSSCGADAEPGIADIVEEGMFSAVGSVSVSLCGDLDPATAVAQGQLADEA